MICKSLIALAAAAVLSFAVLIVPMEAFARGGHGGHGGHGGGHSFHSGGGGGYSGYSCNYRYRRYC
jgi:uncharacterized membrane protein YgcG